MFNPLFLTELQKAKSRAQNSSNFKEEASICNQLGELLAKNGDYQAAIEEHRQELVLSETLHDVIGCAVANRRIGECYAELGNIKAALKHQRQHLDLARSVSDAAEEQRALATIGRTYLFLHDRDQSQDSLKQAKDAFKKSLAIVDERLEGTVSARERSEMRARLLLNLGFVCDGLKDPQRCSDFIRQSIYISEKNNFTEDLYRANFNLGSIHFRNGQHSLAIRCFEKSKECARKMSDKFSESECFYNIGKVLLNLGDFLAARRSLKKAFRLGSQQPVEREAVKRELRYAIRGCELEDAMSNISNKLTQEALGLAEGLGDLYCKAGCYTKALDAYHTQLSCAKALGKPARELAVIHVSLAATFSDLRQYHKAIEHYRHELELRQGNAKEECETWLNIASCQEDWGKSMEELDSSYTAALSCAERAAHNKLQRRVLRAWLQVQKRVNSADTDTTEARLQKLCEAEGHGLEESDDEEEEVLQNSEPLDSDIQLSDSGKRNEKGETVLHRACIEGNLKQVQYLVEQGHPLNPRDNCGWTPLHEASNHGHLEIVALLLDRGANINDPGGAQCDGVTPLHDALICGNFKVARLLVQRGALVKTQDPLSPHEISPSQDVSSYLHGDRDPVLPPKPVCGREEYQRAMHNLGSAKFRLLSQSLSEPAFSSTPAVSASHVSALVPEDEYIADDWLEDDLGSAQPKKKRKITSEQDNRRDSMMHSRSQNYVSGSSEPSARGMLHKDISKRKYLNLLEVKFILFILGLCKISSEADSCTVSWLCEQAAQRYYQTCGLLPHLSLQKEGALLSPTDLLLAVLHTNEEVLAEVCSWDLPPLAERYKKACTSLAVEENKRVLRLCEVQDGSPCVTVCGLSLAPACLLPLLRALKLQDSLTELRLSANRLCDDLLPELVSAATTMPRLRLLDISANQITGEGIKKTVNTLEGRSEPCLEELNLSMNPLGDGWSQALACLLSGCPLLTTISLQACGLTARFLQQHRILLASALTDTGHLRSVCLSYNTLGSTGFELVLKTLPLQCLTHLELKAVCKGPTEQPAYQTIVCVVGFFWVFFRCIPLCPSLVSLDLSANPAVTSEGLHSLLGALREAQRPLTHLNLQGNSQLRGFSGC
uniref:Tonsoku-like protein n=1 Tax=Pygocentrus nattereri TaxID=42514 RepID=A0AAR2L8G3_PYGNA